MVRSFSLITILFLLLSFAWPASLRAQTRLESTNFILEELSLGETWNVTSGGSNPVIASGPEVLEVAYNRAVVTWTTDLAASSAVEYGTSTDYTQESKISTLTTSHKVILTGLQAETTYHYRAKATDSAGGVGLSADKVFTTPLESGIKSVEIKDIGYDKALVTWVTGDFTKSELHYGLTLAYGEIKAAESTGLTVEHTVQLTGLKPGTQYHTQVTATNEKGFAVTSNDFTFTTIALPEFKLVEVIPTSANTIDVAWETNTPTSGIIKYRANDEASANPPQSAGDSAYKIKHLLPVKGLIGKTTYRVEITATDEQGTQINSGQKLATTLEDTVPPVIENVNVRVTRSSNRLVFTATWLTDEPSQGKVIVSPKTESSKRAEITGQNRPTTTHSITGAGLEPSTPYTLEAVATDPFGNQGKAEISFATPRYSRTIFQLLADAFFNAFGWLIN